MPNKPSKGEFALIDGGGGGTSDVPPPPASRPNLRPNRSVNDFSSLFDLRSALAAKAAPKPPEEDETTHVSDERADAEEGGNEEQTDPPRQPLDPTIFLSQALQAKHLGEVINDDNYDSISNATEEDLEEVKDPAKTASDPSEYDWVLENYDKNTTEPQCLEDEMKRLLVLKSYLILDAEREEVFDTITGLTSRLMNCSISLVSLIDMGRQWFMSNQGLDVIRETPRKIAFCAHAIMSTEDIFIVKDASTDFRFKDNAAVTGPPHVAFYAGAPLISPEGCKLGTLCVVDSVPRPQGLTLHEKQNMKELAAMTVEAMTRRRQRLYAKHNNPAQVIAQIAHDLLTPLTGVQLSLESLTEDAVLSPQLTTAQKNLLVNASQCSDAIGKICATAIAELRKQQAQNAPERSRNEDDRKGREMKKQKVGGQSVANKSEKDDNMEIQILVDALYQVLDAFPKKVPVAIQVDPNVPKELPIDELKIFRSAVNLLSNACKRTLAGSIQLNIRKPTDEEGFHYLLFECIDTAPDVPVEHYPLLFKPTDYDDVSCIKPTSNGGCEPICQAQSTGLGLYSVAVHIGSLGGEYGFRPLNTTSGLNPPSDMKLPASSCGSIFWFKVPILLRKPSRALGTTTYR